MYTCPDNSAGVFMLSRRKFLKTGLTTGAAAIPLASVLDAAQQPDQHAANVAPSIPSYQMIAMPARLAKSPVRPPSRGRTEFAAWARPT